MRWRRVSHRLARMIESRKQPGMRVSRNSVPTPFRRQERNRSVSRMYYSWFDSRVGPLMLAGSNDGLRLVSFGAGKRARSVDPAWRQDDSAFVEVVNQLQSYFAGERKIFDLQLALEGTEFQKKVWTALRKIPYGETVSYKELAARVGSPKAMRAVGAANGANPIPIIVPCHRVIGNDGSLTGFGGGLPLKKKLLELESRQLKLL
jgi:methylated-DNA-[protein]-cysteine S-methyltransferase